VNFLGPLQLGHYWHRLACLNIVIAALSIEMTARRLFQGLARLRIAKLPGYELPPVDEISTPVVAGH